MSSTTIEFKGSTTAEADGHYSKAISSEKPVSDEQTGATPDDCGDDFVVVYGAKKKSVLVSYNSVDAKAKAVRKELNRLLNG